MNQETLLRQQKYLNNIIEQDHRFVKKIIKPMLGFKSFETAEYTIVGVEAMHMISFDSCTKTRKGYWRTSNSPILSSSLGNNNIKELGFLFFSDYYRKVKRWDIEYVRQGMNYPIREVMETEAVATFSDFLRVAVHKSDIRKDTVQTCVYAPQPLPVADPGFDSKETSLNIYYFSPIDFSAWGVHKGPLQLR